MQSSQGRSIRIGCSSGFWGDSPHAAIQLVRQGGKLDYLVSDYLSEITMCLLARSKQKSAGELKGGAGEGGFIREFVDTVWKPLAKEIMQKKIKIVTNAGGLNPIGLKNAIEKVAKELSIEMPVVAAITGDDLVNNVDQLRNDQNLKQFTLEGETEPLFPEKQQLMSFNAYIGARQIAEAFKSGAQIVITGRCVDSAIALGPLLYEFGWSPNDFDLLSSGSLVGHIIECGAQCTGGNYTDWEISSAAGWSNVGFPIAECFSDGSFVVTKPENTGGVVNVFTVGEQMLYEIGNPGAYFLPDVICDWRQVTTQQVGKNRVLVKGARGLAPTGFYKVSVTSFDGFRGGGMLMIGGIDAAKKAKAVADAIVTRTKFLLKQAKLEDFQELSTEVLGSEHFWGANSKALENREVLLRIAARHSNPKALGIMAREFAPAALAMAPGITGSMDGRPQPAPVIKFYSCLVPKAAVPLTLTLGTEQGRILPVPTLSSYSNVDSVQIPPIAAHPTLQTPLAQHGQKVTVPLVALCCGRSGDKGDASNIGIIARDSKFYPFIRETLTNEAVHKYMSHLVKGSVYRYEVPGINAFNFILTKSLGGGGVQSLQMDRQGKIYAQILLSLPITVPQEWVSDWIKNHPTHSKL